MNTSATGGYLTPTDIPLPGGLTLDQFIQQIIAGITGIAGEFVRPRFQQQPPIQPDIDKDWVAVGITTTPVEGNSYQKQNNTTATLSRWETLEVLCSFYGPNSLVNATILRDGFQIAQNRDVLKTGLINFTDSSDIQRAPNLTNERWFDRQDITINLLREVQRTYAILPLVSAQGNIETDTSPQIIESFNTINVRGS